VSSFLSNNLEQPLLNAWKDLHAFPCFSNLAYQTTRKLSPEIYNEMMTSILYRLTHLSFKNNIFQETIRTALLAFASTIFMIRPFADQPYSHLFEFYGDLLFRLRQSKGIALPVAINLWLSILFHTTSNTDRAAMDRDSGWLKEAVIRANISSWTEAHDMLRSVMWVGFVHDRFGKQAFESKHSFNVK
jgi:hypothetical protein